MVQINLDFNHRFAYIEIESKPLVRLMKESKIIYDADLSAELHAASVAAAKYVGAGLVFFSCTRFAFVIDLNKGSQFDTGLMHSKIASRMTSHYSCAAYKYFGCRKVVYFDAEFKVKMGPANLIKSIRRAQSVAINDNLMLAGRKMLLKHEETHGKGQGELKVMLLKAGIDYDNLPQSYREGVCMDQNGEQVVSMSPGAYVQSYLNKLSREEAAA